MSVSSNLWRKDVIGYWTLRLGWSGKESTVIWVLFLLSSSQDPPPHLHLHPHPSTLSPTFYLTTIHGQQHSHFRQLIPPDTFENWNSLWNHHILTSPHPTSPSPSWLMHWISCICNNQIRNNWLFAKMFNLNPEAVTIPYPIHKLYPLYFYTFYFCPESGTLRAFQDTCMQD